MPATINKPKGSKPDKHVRDALIAAARRDDFIALKRMAEKVLEKAQEGDMQAVTFVAERIDGKVPQAVIGDDDSDAIKIDTNMTVRFVRADRPS